MSGQERDRPPMSLTVMPPIPRELTDFIIDLVQDDRATVESCALTSKAWLSRSRRYIHRSIRLRHMYGAIFSPKEIARVKQLLELPVITEFATELVLEECAHEYPDPTELPSDPEEDDWLDFALFRRVVDRCVNVCALVINHLEWDPLITTLNAKRALMEQLWKLNVESLTITGGNFKHAEEFYAFINSFPRLSCLTLGSGWITFPRVSHTKRLEAFQTDLCSLQGLKELKIRQMDFAVCRALFYKLGEYKSPIQKLDLEHRPPSKPLALLDNVSDLLGASCVKSLTTLRLSFDSFLRDTRAEITELVRCEVLDTIEFDFCLEMYRHLFAVPASAWTVALDILRNNAPPSLKHVRISCIPNTYDLDNVDLPGVEAFLLKASFSLRSFIIEDAADPATASTFESSWGTRVFYDEEVTPRRAVLPRVVSYPQFRAAIVAGMPVLASRGTLQCVSRMRAVHDVSTA